MLHRVEEYAGLEEVLAEIHKSILSRRRVEMLRATKAFGRVAAKDLHAPADIPPHPTSHMDGFAVIAADASGASDAAPVTLSIKGKGSLVGPRMALKPGEAARIATGGGLPSGADTVLPLESVEETGDRLLVRNSPPSGNFVYQAGQDFKRGETVIEAGRTIRAQDLGMLVSLGLDKVEVLRRPKVTVLATGSELSNSSRPKAGKVRNSHSPVFISLLEAQGCRVVDGGVVPDDVGKMASAIRGSLAESDLVITLGGTSVGRHDLTGKVVKDMRPEAAFHGIRMDRGRVTGVAVVRGKPILMLPGPIQGAMNAFFLIGVPIIKLLSGKSDPDLEIPCKIGDGWEARRRFSNFRKVVYIRLGRGVPLIAEPISGETESIKVLTRADGYLSVPETVTQIPKGAEVNVKIIYGFSTV